MALEATVDSLRAVSAFVEVVPPADVDPARRSSVAVAQAAEVPPSAACLDWAAAVPVSDSCLVEVRVAVPAAVVVIPDFVPPLDPLEFAGNFGAMCHRPWLESSTMVRLQPAAPPRHCPSRSSGSPHGFLAFVSCT